MNLNLAIWLLGIVVGCASFERHPSQYNEARTQSGEARPEYQGLLEAYENLTQAQRNEFLRLSNRDFGGDNPLLPLPRVLSTDEAFLLRQGVMQRADALRLFLIDLYSGQKTYRDAGVIPDEVLDRVLKRSLNIPMEGRLNPEALGFFYGPDIIRNTRSEFRVIEDNPGYVGGLGDMIAAKEIFEKRAPGLLAQAGESPDPKRFYDEFMDRFRTRSKPPGGRIVFLRYPKANQADNETLRLEKLLRTYGAEVVVIPGPGSRYANKLEVRSDGLFLVRKESGRTIQEPVGFVVVEGEAFDVDPSFEGYQLKYWVDEARAHREQVVADGLINEDLPSWLDRLDSKIRQAFEKQDRASVNRLKDFLKKTSPIVISDPKDYGIPGFWRLVQKGKVGASTSPGIDFLGDKELYIYVENMIRFYLKQEPLIQNLPTRPMIEIIGRGESLDETKLDSLLADRDRWVFKKVDGRGGSEVWVGPKVTKQELKKLRKAIVASPDEFIVQEYTQLSQLENHLVDLRLLASVDSKRNIVAEVPWGRAKPIGGNGKVNLSDGGAETLVIVRSRLGQLRCSRATKKFLR